MVDTLAHREERLVTPISAVRRHDLELAGGKGANLGELMQGGFPVPDGFIVSTEAYATVVEEAGLASVIADSLAASDRADGIAASDGGAMIRAAFENVTIPDDLAAAISKAYADLGGGPVAVRSSATAEDLVGAAFAGQQDTYLNVVGDTAVLDAVRRCWGSLWTERALAYRRHQEIESGSLQIAVVVQQMVEAELAGVMFTANPVTGNRDEIVIDASSGLGEAVVAGLVTPDHYVLDSQGRGSGAYVGPTRGDRPQHPRRRRHPLDRRRFGCGQPARSGSDRARGAGPRGRRTLRPAAGHRVGVRRRPDLASSGASDDRAAPAPAQAEPHTAQARAPVDGLHDGAAVPARHERVGQAGHRTHGGADAGRDHRAPPRYR